MLIDKWLDFCYEHVWSEVVIFYWVFMTFLHWQDETDPDKEMIWVIRLIEIIQYQNLIILCSG